MQAGAIFLISVRKVSRPSDNQLRWRWDPDAFGNEAPNENPQGLGAFTYNLRFPGQYLLSESGLFQNYFRDYDKNIGRYTESDPIGLLGGLNTYTYVMSNPVGSIDPTGLIVQRCCRKARIAAGLVDHCWLSTNTIKAEMNDTAQCSQPGENRSDLLWVTPVVVSDASCETGGRCEVINDVDEQCVNRELEIGRSLGRFGLLNNCQTFAWTVLTKCSTKQQHRPEPSVRFLAR